MEGNFKTRIKSFYGKHKKKIFTILRIVVSVGLIAYLIKAQFKDFKTILDMIKTVNIPLLLAAASIHIFGIWISAVRWQLLLKTQGIRISKGYLASSFLIGSFFNNILPTSVGGDIFRSLDIANKTKISVGKSASVLVIDRFAGVISAALYAVIALFLGFATIGTTSYVIPIAIFFAISIIFGFLILNPSILRLNKIVRKIKFLSKIREKLMEVYHTFLSFKKYKLALIEALLCSLALQFGVICNYYLAARSLGINLSLASFIFIVPVVATIAMLPITIGGTGLRENALVFFMVALGAQNQKAAMTSLVIFAMILVPGIIGGIIYAVRPFILRQSQPSQKALEQNLNSSVEDMAEQDNKS
ncbi:MAG: flippase-like domain-containing protein [Actinobacteria bacterium]|nr:flippase-like domain-containing protein [Actinomycetota bacterium]